MSEKFVFHGQTTFIDQPKDSVIQNFQNTYIAGDNADTDQVNKEIKRLLELILNSQDLLFSSLNPTRGLGLLLYGLLKKSFELPSIWNGPGHSDVLIMLPRLLLSEMTCSSWTLGVLQSCLLSRSTENMILSTRQQKGPIDDDRLLDPYPLITAREVAVVLSVCQEVLKNCQLSTLRHRARQLTPINVRQLTDPNWSEVFKGRLE